MNIQLINLSKKELLDQIEELMRKVAREEISTNVKAANADEETIWTVKDIENFFGLSSATIHRLRKRGVFPSFKVGHSRFFTKAEIIEAMKNEYRSCA